MNINASSQTLINTLLQQAMKTQDKKRPTFEEVFAKLNARSSKIDPNRQPINAMLTNEQLFRYYIKETEPKLHVSNEVFSSDELFNPIKDSDPNKVYGQSSVLTSDIAQSLNPANNLPNVGIPDAPSAPSAPTGAPRVPRVPTSPYTPDQQADIDEAEMFIDSGADFLSYFNNIDMASVAEESKEFLNVIFAKGVGDGDWSELGQYMFDRLNNRGDEAMVIADLFQVMNAFRAMPEGLTKYHIPRAIFKLTSPPNSSGTIDDYKAILEGSEVDLRKRFYNHRDSNGAGLREADGSYSRRTRVEGERQFDKYKLDKFDPIDAVSAFFIADNQAKLDYIKTGKDYERYEGDPNWVNPRLIEVQQRRRLGANGAVIQGLLDDMFNDIASQLTTNTDINSNEIDDQLIANFARRQNIPIPEPEEDIQFPSSSPSSTIAEAGSGEANIDDVLMRVPRGRGVQLGDVRGKYEKTRKREGASTLQASVRRALQQQEMGMGAKGGGI
jgi:hypothetical protein